MHILIINFNLDGVSHEDYEASCLEVAPVFAALPGLISKTWLADEATNTYGGVYVWESHQAVLDYKESDVMAQLLGNPVFTNITVTDFGILAGPSGVTGIS